MGQERLQENGGGGARERRAQDCRDFGTLPQKHSTGKWMGVIIYQATTETGVGPMRQEGETEGRTMCRLARILWRGGHAPGTER